MPPNILVPRDGKVDDNKGQFTTGFEMTQLKLNKGAEDLESQVFPVHLLNVLGKILNILTTYVDGEFVFGQKFGDFWVLTGDHMPVVVHDRPSRQARVDRVRSDDRQARDSLDIVNNVTGGNNPRGLPSMTSIWGDGLEEETTGRGGRGGGGRERNSLRA